jgi:hypothetical protein
MTQPNTSTSPELEPVLILAELRTLASAEWQGELSLVPLRANARRQDHDYRRAFIVVRGGAPLAHLTVGRRETLHALWQKTDAFHGAYPELAARPFFHKQSQQRGYLAREFISGHTLAEGIIHGKFTPEKAHTIAQETLTQMRKSAAPSSVEAAQAEAAAVLAKTESLPELTAIDRAFLTDLITPLVTTGIAATTPKLFWTNGDFTPHNLVVADTTHPRLIDYEFVSQTHFPDDEWRWNTFGGTAQIPQLSIAPPPWLEIFFWCRQLLLSDVTIKHGETAADTEHAFEEITALLRKDMTSWTNSLFLRRLSPSGPLEKELARLTTAEAALSEKLSRTLTARSWRYTAWLRAIRRLLNRLS